MSRRRNDPGLYRDRGEAWWDPGDPFARSLREVNRLRLVVIRRLLDRLPPRPLVVDVGCGGGLITAPLAAAGARALGVDPEGAGLLAASRRGGAYCRGDGLRLPLADGCADLVCLADVVEHVPAWRRLLSEAVRVAAPGGLLYVNTIAAGPLSRALAVWLGEGTGLVPRGTHDARLFVAPGLLVAAARRLGLRPEGVVAEAVDPIASLSDRRLRLRFARRVSAGYSVWFTREV